jgi:uncharacterized OB-fold protein
MGQIPIHEKLFTERIGGSLLGAKCRACGHVLAPLTMTCCYCRGEDLEEVALSARGIFTAILSSTSRTRNLAHLTR